MTKISPSLVKLAEPVLGKPVRIIVWKNGEFDSQGQEISISPKALRSWNSILVYLTKLMGHVGAIRKLYHLPTKKTVWCFDELIPGDKYVAAGFEKLKMEKNAYQTVSDKRYSILQTLKFTSKTQSIKSMLDTITYTQKKKRTIIYIMVNGKSCVNPCKIVFIEDDLHDWDIVLQYMGHRLNVPEGIQYFCTVNGEIVFEPHQMQHGDLYIGVPFGQRFKKIDYVKLFQDLIKHQRERTSYYPRSKRSKGKKPLSATFAPWSVKNRKGARNSATILSPLPINTTERTTTSSGGPYSNQRLSFPGRHSPRGSTARSSRDGALTLSSSKSPSKTKSSSSSKVRSNQEFAVYNVVSDTQRTLTTGEESHATSVEKSCKSAKCRNKSCRGNCEKKSGVTIGTSGSQTTKVKKTAKTLNQRLGSVINACLDTVENYGFIEPQKTEQFHQARASIQNHIKKASAKQVDNDYDESSGDEGTHLTTFAQIAQRGCFQRCDDELEQVRELKSHANSKLDEYVTEAEKPAKIPLKEPTIEAPRRKSLKDPIGNSLRSSLKPVVFEDNQSIDRSSDSDEIAVIRTFSKRTLSGKEIEELRQFQNTTNISVPKRDSVDIYKEKMWHSNVSHTGLEKVPPVISNVNFVKSSSCDVTGKHYNISQDSGITNKNTKGKEHKLPSYLNEVTLGYGNITKNTPSCCETILDTSNADVDEIWKKPSAPSTDKSTEERLGSENGSDTSRTTSDNKYLNSNQRSPSKIKSGSAPSINCCTSDQIEPVIRRIKRRHYLEYVSSDEDPFAACERRARAKNGIVNRNSTIFGQLGLVVMRNGQNIIEEHIEKPPAEGVANSGVKNRASKNESALGNLVKLTSVSQQTPIVNIATQNTDLSESSTQRSSISEVAMSNSRDVEYTSSHCSQMMGKMGFSRVKIVSLDLGNENKSTLDPIISCSEQSSSTAKNESSKDKIIRTSYSDVDASTFGGSEDVSKCFRNTCYSLGCSEICLRNSTVCDPCHCNTLDDQDPGHD